MLMPSVWKSVDNYKLSRDYCSCYFSIYFFRKLKANKIFYVFQIIEIAFDEILKIL